VDFKNQIKEVLLKQLGFYNDGVGRRLTAMEGA